MPTPLASYAEYSRFIFALLVDRDTVEKHTLTIYTISSTISITRGQIFFRSGHVLKVFEQIDFIAQRILKYFYEVDYEDEPLWWYDPMPHPHIPELQSTHPHHKHIPPDIKHHRVPTAELSFTEPNLPHLIVEVETIIA